MPALAAACLMTACIFCDNALVAVVNSILRRLPSRARTPSAPRFHTSGVEKVVGLVDAELPADVLGAESLGGIEKVPRGLSQPAEDLLLDRCAIHENGEGSPHDRIGQEGMHGLEARSLAVDLRPRIGLIQLDVSDAASEADGHATLAALLEPQQHVVLDAAHFRRVVVLARLQDSTRGGHRVASPLH